MRRQQLSSVCGQNRRKIDTEWTVEHIPRLKQETDTHSYMSVALLLILFFYLITLNKKVV